MGPPEEQQCECPSPTSPAGTLECQNLAEEVSKEKQTCWYDSQKCFTNKKEFDDTSTFLIVAGSLVFVAASATLGYVFYKGDYQPTAKAVPAAPPGSMQYSEAQPQPGDVVIVGAPISGPQMIDVAVPANALPGTLVQIQHQGQTLQVAVPEGYFPGQAFRVQV